MRNYLLVIERRARVTANYAKSFRDFARGNVEVNRRWPRPPLCITVLQLSQTPTPKLSVSKINHPWSGLFRRISTHSFLLPRPLVHFWKGDPPYGGSHYLRRGISISISCGNSFRNLPGPRALSYYGIMRDVIRITLNRMIHIQSSRFNHSSLYQLKYQVFIHVMWLRYDLSRIRKEYFAIYKIKILIFCVCTQ